MSSASFSKSSFSSIISKSRELKESKILPPPKLNNFLMLFNVSPIGFVTYFSQKETGLKPKSGTTLGYSTVTSGVFIQL